MSAVYHRLRDRETGRTLVGLRGPASEMVPGVQVQVRTRSGLRSATVGRIAWIDDHGGRGPVEAVALLERDS
jgi:hypothetical protein